MHRRAIALLAACAAALPAQGQGQPASGAVGPAVILDESGYFRIHYQFGLMRISAQALKEEGEQLLRPGGMKQLQRETRQHLKDQAIDWTAVDWRDLACVHFVRTQQGDDTRAAEMIPTVAAPADWAQPDFDDGSWLRQRLGRLPRSRYMKEAYDFSSLLARGIYLRTYFQVTQPAQAGDLTLELTYRGGARVLVNGVEVARGDLPDGPVTSDTPGRDYPRQAYLVLPPEGPGGGGGGIFGDIRCPYDQAPRYERKESGDVRVNAAGQPINRQGWQRLTRLRDRTLGPVIIPARLLRRGSNVLAIEIRGSHFHPQILPGAGAPQADNWGRHGGTENHSWDHARLLSVRLTCAGQGVPPCTTRPAGVQAWGEDMHTRVFSPDFNPPGWPAGMVRLVGCPNGTFAGQVVLGTTAELANPRATVTDLTGPGGIRIPASALAVSFLRPTPVTEMFKLGHERCLGMYHWNESAMATLAVARYGPEDASKLLFFDHIAGEPPPTIPADSCQPVWLSLKVPSDAPCGEYSGTVAISAKGFGPLTLPVELEVIGWRVPGAGEFQTLVESEQSPYSVAKAYKVAPWSEEHFRLMGTSFAQLARLGADWVFVPVLLHSEFGNRDDAGMIRWLRRPDGTLTFDYQVLDRYLDLASRHLGKPRVICFAIMHGCPSSTQAVKIFDPAAGREEVVDVGPNASESRRPIWRAFATALVEHMQAKGLRDSMYWGHAFDSVTDPGLIKLMEEFTPGIHWAAGAHGRKPDDTFRAVARAYGSDVLDRSLLGWRNPYIHLLMPRTNGSVICVEGTSTPFTYRVMCDRAIYAGFNGIGRMGADYFNLTWMDGFSGGQYLLVGRSCVQTLWPGPDGIQTGARNEVMLEGLQEAEARVFLEQTLAAKVLGQDSAERVRKVLDDHFRATLYIPGGTASAAMMDYTGDWQGRSRRLYQAAAEVAGRVGIDTDRTEIGSQSLQSVRYGSVETLGESAGVPLAALGQTRVSLRLRNWTAQPRKWQAATTQPWIRPLKSSGDLAGQEDLPILLDGAALKAGQKVAGELTITDLAAGRSTPVWITAGVLKAVDFIARNRVFNVTVGSSESRDFLLVNRTTGGQTWQISSSAPWLTVEPARGQLDAGESTFVKVTARPTDPDGARHETALVLLAAGGAVKEQWPFRTFVIPPYRRPERLPAGQPVPLESVSSQLLLRHRSIGWFTNRPVHDAPTFGAALDVWHSKKPLIIGQETYPAGLWIIPAHETVYRLTGSGFVAFSAEVGWNAMVAKSDYGAGHHNLRMNFQVHADGKVVAQSGPMKATDPARLLVAENLAAVKELKLVSRTDFDEDDKLGIAYCNWAVPTFYRAK